MGVLQILITLTSPLLYAFQNERNISHV